MRKISMFRTMTALTLALSALAITVAPAAAETVLINCNGTCGSWQVSDTGPTGPKGAVCKYENASGDLDFISVRPPLVHGNYPNRTKVGWRFKIQQSPSAGPQWTTTFTSSWQYAQADDAIPAYAGHGFARRYWYASETPSGYFQVRVEMGWWRGSSREGFARVEYDHYKVVWSGTSNYVENGCFYAFP